MKSRDPFARRRWLSLGLLASVTTVLFALAPEPGPASPEPCAAGAKFIGAAKCALCHKADAVGNQYGKWQATPHAKAFELLASDKAKEVAKAKAIDDPQKSDQCLKCHVTAFGVAAEDIAKGFDPALGVQCETCHGPGETHMKARVAAAAKSKDGKVEPVPAGEIDARPTADTCTKCHNKDSPTFKPFCFHDRRAKIAHLNPSKTRTPEELKAIEGSCACESCKDDGCGAECAAGKGG
jgi:hypothetical protein